MSPDWESAPEVAAPAWQSAPEAEPEKTKVAGQSWTDHPIISTADYFGQHVADAFNSAWDGLKSDWQARASEEAKAKASPSFWGRQKSLFKAQLLTGKLPIDAFGIAMSGINGLLDAAVVEPIARGEHVILPDVPLEDLKQDVADALWVIAPETGSLGLRAGFPRVAEVAPAASELQAGRTVLATMKTGDAAAIKGTEQILTNLAAKWAKTGEDPASLVQRAQTDPVLREQLQSPHPIKPPEGSSVTPSDDGDFIIPRSLGVPRGLEISSYDPISGSGGFKFPIETQTKKQGLIVGNVNKDQTIFTIKTASNPIPGQGFGTKAYADLAEQVLAKGAVLHSDSEVSLGASKVYDKLAKQGFTVEKNPDAVVNPGRGLTVKRNSKAGNWVYRVTAGPGERPLAERPLAERLEAAKKWEGNAPIGSLSEAEEAIGAHIAQPVPKSFSFGDLGRKVYDEMFDDQAPWKRLLTAARDAKSLPDAANNAEFLQKLSTGARGLGHYGLETNQIDLGGNVVGPALQDILKPFAGTEDFAQFERYAVARRADELHAKGIETGLNDNAVQKMANDPAMRKKYEDSFQKLVSFQNNDLKILHDSGFLSDEAYKNTLSEHPNRIPFQREIEGKTTPSGAGGTTYNPMKNIVGSERRILGPIEQIMRQHMVRMELAVKSQANTALIRELEPAGFAIKSASQVRPIELSSEEIDRIVEAHGGEAIEDFDATIFRHFKLPLADDEIPVFEDGKMQAYKLADPEAAKVLRGMGQPAVAIWTKVMRGFAAVQRAGIVLNPAFSVRQILYDIPFQHIVTPGFRNTAADFWTGLTHGLMKTAEADKFMRSGAWRPIFDQVSSKYISSKVAANYGKIDFAGGIRNAITSPIRALRAWADMVYSAQRRGRFIRETRAGASREEAAISAQGATFHTGEKGSFSRQINQVQPFFSAYMNSIKRTSEAFARDPVGTFGKAAAVITAPVLLNWLAYHNEDWYKEAPEYKKDMGMLFPPTEGNDPWFLPVVPMLSIPFAAIPRRMLEAVFDKNPHAFDGFMGDAAKEFLPWQATYNMMLPVIENIANFSYFRGHPLISSYAREHNNAPEQYTPYTSQTAKELSKHIDDIPLLRDFNLAPWQIDNLVQGWSGTLGVDAMKISDALLAKDGGKPGGATPETTLADNPWLGSFAIRYPSANTQSMTTYNDRYSQFEKDHGSLETAIKNNDVSRFLELIARNPVVASEKTAFRGRNKPQDLPAYLHILQQNRQAGLVPTLRGLANVQKALQTDYQFEQNIRNNPKMDGHDKRQLLDQTYGQMTEYAKLGNLILDRLGVP